MSAEPSADSDKNKDKERDKDKNKEKDQEHPPCPSAGEPPPGHDKGAEPQDRPCDGGRSGDVGDAAGGILLAPFALVGSALTATRPLVPGNRWRRWLRPRPRAR